MTTPNRRQVLRHNQAVRNGSAPVRRLDEGYVALKIPEDDFKVLKVLYPDLLSKDNAIRLAAWKKLEASEIGDKYRVTKRSPAQVKRATKLGNSGIIVK